MASLAVGGRELRRQAASDSAWCSFLHSQELEDVAAAFLIQVQDQNPFAGLLQKRECGIDGKDRLANTIPRPADGNDPGFRHLSAELLGG